MPGLGTILRAQYEGLLAARQFHRDKAFPNATTFTRNGLDSLTFDRMKGGDLRVVLGIGLPEPEIEAESPSWPVLEVDSAEDWPAELNPNEYTLEHALKCAWQFLDGCGLAWFENPMLFTPSEWRKRHKLLIQDHRLVEVTLSWEKTLPLNERIIRAKRCVPLFSAIPAMEMRAQFLNVDSIYLDRMPFATALELKGEVEKAGLVLEVQPPQGGPTRIKV